MICFNRLNCKYILGDIMAPLPAISGFELQTFEVNRETSSEGKFFFKFY